MVPIKLRQAGGSITATLPKEMTTRMNVEVGDTVYAVWTPKGILLTPYSSELEEGISLAAEAGRTYRHALRELGK